MTMPSPCTLGSVTMRTSIGWPSMFSDTRPSCGSRRSAMSRLAMIFTRDTTPATMRRGIVVLSLSTPSTRKRTRISRPSGSKWRSEAPSCTAWAMIVLTSLMTGASSADSRMSETSARSSVRSSCTASAIASSSRFMRAIRLATSSADATTGRSSWPVSSLRSSSASTFDGSAIATSSTPPSNADRHGVVAPRGLRVDEVEGAQVRLEDRQVDVVEPEALGGGPRELLGAERAPLDQHLLRRAAGGLGLLHRLPHARLGHEAELDDDV